MRIVGLSQAAGYAGVARKHPFITSGPGGQQVQHVVCSQYLARSRRLSAAAEWQREAPFIAMAQAKLHLRQTTGKLLNAGFRLRSGVVKVAAKALMDGIGIGQWPLKTSVSSEPTATARQLAACEFL